MLDFFPSSPQGEKNRQFPSKAPGTKDKNKMADGGYCPFCEDSEGFAEGLVCIGSDDREEVWVCPICGYREGD